MLKVAYVLTPILFGGAEKVSLNILKTYDRTRFRFVPVLLVRPWEEPSFFARELEMIGMAYKTLPVASKPPGAGKDHLRLLKCYAHLFSILKQGHFDIVHTNGYFADILGIPLAGVLQIPHISTCHGFIDNDLALKVYNRLDRFFLRWSDRIVCVAEDIKEKLVSSGIKAHKISTITNAVPLPDCSRNHRTRIRSSARKKFNIAEDELLVGYVGRLSQEKGLTALIHAGKMLLSEGWGFKIMLMGDGPQRTELSRLADQLGMAEIVVFAGFQKSISTLLPAVDIFVLPSLTEGTPLALLEAMSHGIPSVATRVGGIPHIIKTGQNGVLVSPSNPSGLKRAISLLFKDKSYRTKLSRAAVQTMERRFNLNAQVKDMELLYLAMGVKKGRDTRC